MTLIAKRHRRRRWGSLMIAVVVMSGLTAIGAVVTAHSGVTSIPSNYFTVVDTGGANDVNSDQVDLTQMGRDDTNASKYSLFWSWDSINNWTGTGQTGDACALFDTGTDGKIDKAVCARVANVNADPNNVQIVAQDSTHPVFLFDCSNAKNDRCAQPSNPLPYQVGTQITAGALAGSTIAPNLITDTDPFAAGQSFPHDTSIAITVLKSLVGNGNLVNVCSYPSAGNGGNNNPFDCIVNPGSGFLKIIKNAGSDTTTDFSFAVVPAPQTGSPVVIKGSGDSGNLATAFTTTGSVTESVPTNWNLTGASCKKADNTSTGTFDSANHKVTGITIQSGLLTTCTFVDAPATGTLIVIKTVDNTNAPGSTNTAANFKYTGGGTTGLSAVTAAASPGNSHSLNAGTTFAVTEDGVASGKITVGGVSYTVSYSGCSGTITSGQTSTCTITNTAAGGTLIVIKTVDNTNAPGSTNTAANFKYTGGGTTGLSAVTAAASPGNSHSLNAGTTFAVTEDGVASGKITVGGVSYTVSYSGCSGTITSGQTSTCTITNTAAGGTLIVIKTVDNTNAPGSTNTAANFKYTGGGTTGLSAVTAAASPGNSHSLNAGTTFAVTEDGVASGKITVGGVSYTVSYSGCSGTITSGQTSTCTITNTADKANPDGNTTMSWLVDDSSSYTIRAGASNAASATITFKLYSDSSCTTQVGTDQAKTVALTNSGATASADADGYTVGVGTYYWRTFYSGDNANNAASTACGSEITTITNTEPPTP